MTQHLGATEGRGRLLNGGAAPLYLPLKPLLVAVADSCSVIFDDIDSTPSVVLCLHQNMWIHPIWVKGMTLDPPLRWIEQYSLSALLIT